MNADDALFELSMLNAESSTATFDDFYIWGSNKGLPTEILTRLKVVWDYTKDIADETVALGKIIVRAIKDFLQNNPHLAAGIALGAVVGLLSGSLPFIGTLLLPVSTVITTVYGAGVGAAIDNGESVSDSTSPMVAAIHLAKKALEFLLVILQTLAAYFAAE